jgi:hypothetical protein
MQYPFNLHSLTVYLTIHFFFRVKPVHEGERRSRRKLGLAPEFKAEDLPVRTRRPRVLVQAFEPVPVVQTPEPVPVATTGFCKSRGSSGRVASTGTNTGVCTTGTNTGVCTTGTGSGVCTTGTGSKACTRTLGRHPYNTKQLHMLYRLPHRPQHY